jgi:hypothetical protein
LPGHCHADGKWLRVGHLGKEEQFQACSETFSQCATSEGVRFSIWNGVAYKRKLIWSGGYCLGYATEENCPL